MFGSLEQLGLRTEVKCSRNIGQKHSGIFPCKNTFCVESDFADMLNQVVFCAMKNLFCDRKRQEIIWAESLNVKKP